jgi:hypothetical protein
VATQLHCAVKQIPQRTQMLGEEVGLRLVTLVEGVIASVSPPRVVASGCRQEVDVRSRSLSGVTASVAVVFDVPADLADFGLSVLPGDQIIVVGTTRRRFFRSGGATISRTEVEAAQFVVNPTKRVRRKVVADLVSVLMAGELVKS